LVYNSQERLKPGAITLCKEIEKVKKEKPEIGPLELAILSKKFEAIVSEMSNTVLRTARSRIISSAKDFSCGLTTSDAKMICIAEASPVHVGRSGLATEAMNRLHPDLKEGDAYYSNSPYYGNTHHSDHSILVPVFYKGEYIFCAYARTHQADTGNAIPVPYYLTATDMYAEGAIDFPVVKVQENYEDIDDMIRMGRMKIRNPDVWYGDYLATLGGARIGEKRLKKLCERYGIDYLRAFLDEWQTYGKRKMQEELSKFPKGTWVGGAFYPPGLGTPPEGIQIRVKLTSIPEEGRVIVDLTDNIDCLPSGLNLSEFTSGAAVLAAIFNCVDPETPKNDGAASCVEIKMRENCAVGIPRFPASCSAATTNLYDMLVIAVVNTITMMGKGLGMAEPVPIINCHCLFAGQDARRGNAPYVDSAVTGAFGGAGVPGHDGWLTFWCFGSSGVLRYESIEMIEQTYPLHYEQVEVLPDTMGDGEWDGAPGCVMEVRDRFNPAFWPTIGIAGQAKGAWGGKDGAPPYSYVIDLRTGKRRGKPIAQMEGAWYQPYELLGSFSAGGGG
jgi:N-methylhydantoinase B